MVIFVTAFSMFKIVFTRNKILKINILGMRLILIFISQLFFNEEQQITTAQKQNKYKYVTKGKNKTIAK